MTPLKAFGAFVFSVAFVMVLAWAQQRDIGEKAWAPDEQGQVPARDED